MTTKDREAFIDDLVANNFTTFFAVTHPKYATGNKAYRFTPAPVSRAVPHGWKYAETRARLFELGALLTVEEAERRNINFVNPTLRDYMPAATLPTLRGGIQLLLPGEQAHTHRHSANAFRFVLEAPDEGVYTVVEGVKVPMRPGDLVLTPNWTWHDHHNDSDTHAIWYDGLDVLMAFFVGGVFSDEYQDVEGTPYRGEGSTTATLDDFYFPYSTARERLQQLQHQGAGTDYDGVLLEYVHARTGNTTFPSMGNALRLVPGKTTLRPKHRAENVVFITFEGSVTFHLPEGRTVRTEPFDVTAVPSWVPYSIENTEREPSVLFSNTDRPLFEKLGFYREAEL